MDIAKWFALDDMMVGKHHLKRRARRQVVRATRSGEEAAGC